MEFDQNAVVTNYIGVRAAKHCKTFTTIGNIRSWAKVKIKEIIIFGKISNNKLTSEKRILLN